MNIVVLRGSLPRDPDRRTLATGGDVLQFDLNTPLPSEAGTATVPVSWFDPPAAVSLAAGTEVVVVGAVRRRFFRAGGATQSRTEVVATRVTPSSKRGTVSKLLAAAASDIAAG